jgi:hypothetical protein
LSYLKIPHIILNPNLIFLGMVSTKIKSTSTIFFFTHLDIVLPFCSG